MKTSRLAWLTATLLATALPTLHAALAGLTLSGETFTYNAPSGVVTGRLKLPPGTGPFPAVLVSHGKGGTAASMMAAHGTLLVNAGLVCIAPDYTHAGSNVNVPANEGYCPENSRRARACLEILQSLGTVDMTRVGAFSHSMGSFLTVGLCGEPGIGIRAAVISAGGTSGSTDTSLASPATTEVQGIVAPMLMFHGTADTTVLPAQSASLDTILAGKGVAHRRVLYQGVDHDIITLKKTDIHALLRAWFTTHGILSSSSNKPPTLSAPGTISAPAGVASAPTTLTVGDGETSPASLSLAVFSTNDARLPASALILGGSGSSRTLALSPTVGAAEKVELAVVVSDNQFSTAAFITASITSGGLSEAVNQRPTLSRINDQRVPPGTAVTGLTFTIDDAETAASALTVSASSSNATLLPASGILLGGSDANRTVTLSPSPGQTGVATLTLTVSDGLKTSASAFTLTVAPMIAGNTPPLIQALTSEILPAGGGYATRPLVIKDDESAESSLTLSASSSNPDLIPNSAIVFGGQNWGRTVTITPSPTKTGRSTITFTVSDGANTGSSACVIEVVAADTPPTFAGLSTHAIQLTSTSETVVTFSVSDAEAPPESLRVTAASSNADLLPDLALQLTGTGTSRSLSLLPKPAAVGATTITLAMSDGTFTRESQLLFVMRNPDAPSEKFQRPRGIYALDSSGGTTYTTTFGKSVSLRDSGIRNLPFVDGFTLRVAWEDVESGTVPGAYDFKIIANALAKLPAGQHLALIIVPAEPAYIAQASGFPTWNDNGTIRACPWSSYLRERRRALIQAMAAFVPNGVALSAESRLAIIDPYLPGGFTGIRDPNSTALHNLPGYTRALLLAAVQEEIRAWQDAFTGKFVQLGFWPVVDNENSSYGGVTASEWLRQQLLAEFNGINRPHIGFFMENLAAKRSGSPEAAFTGTPVTAFASPLALSRDSAWTAFQMLGSWARPFSDGHVNNTLNGTPADAMEYAFNTYGTEYHEIYPSDLDTPGYQAAFQSWHDFFARAAASAPPATPPTTPTDTPPATSPPAPLPQPGTPSPAPAAESKSGGGSLNPLFTLVLLFFFALRQLRLCKARAARAV